MVQCIIFIISDFFKPLSLKYSIDFENSWTELVGYTCEPVQDCFYCKRSPMDTCFAGCSIDNQHFGNFSFFWRLLIFQKSFKTIYRQYDYFSTNFDQKECAWYDDIFTYYSHFTLCFYHQVHLTEKLSVSTTGFSNSI